MASRFRSLLSFVLGLLVAGLVVTGVGGPVHTVGSSMMPSVVHDEILWAWRWPLLVHRDAARGLRRGDVVVFRSPITRGQLLKRVVALPGDRVSIEASVVRVNGQVFPDRTVRRFWADQECLETDGAGDRASVPYLGLVPERRSLVVPAGELFVMGDNRTSGGSEDSRMFGPVAASRVEGLATAVVWPVVRREVKVACRLMAASPELMDVGWSSVGGWVWGVRSLGGLPDAKPSGLVPSVRETRGVVMGFLK